jgi:hypothetical protein
METRLAGGPRMSVGALDIMDDETRRWFETKFEGVHDLITKNAIGVTSLRQEIVDLKGDGYFVRPGTCKSLHDRVSDQVSGIEKRLAYYAGAIAIIAVVFPFILKYVFKVT